MRKLIFKQDTSIIKEYSMFASNLKKELQKFSEKGTVALGLNIKSVTKTRLSLSVEIGSSLFSLDTENSNFKQAYKETYSFFSSETKQNYYFALSKKQSVNVLKQYATEQLENIFVQLEKYCRQNGLSTDFLNTDINVFVDYAGALDILDKNELLNEFNMAEVTA